MKYTIKLQTSYEIPDVVRKMMIDGLRGFRAVEWAEIDNGEE